jgi:hypothetical protein
MSKHTPGPWSVGHTRHYKHSGGIDGTEVAIHYGPAETRGNCIAHCYGHGPIGDAEKDARLIAAAPDLLAALREIQANPNDPRAHRTALDVLAKVGT